VCTSSIVFFYAHSCYLLLCLIFLDEKNSRFVAACIRDQGLRRPAWTDYETNFKISKNNTFRLACVGRQANTVCAWFHCDTLLPRQVCGIAVRSSDGCSLFLLGAWGDASTPPSSNRGRHGLHISMFRSKTSNPVTL
jgi:hypothetical protein